MREAVQKALAVLIAVIGCGCTAFEHEEAMIPSLKWEKRSDWVSVTDLGAVGDGVTDDTSAIQKALDILDDGKGWQEMLRSRVVYFPPGRYRITATLAIPKSHGAWIVGHGRDTVLVWDGKEGERMCWSNGCTYARYEGITWDCAGKAAIAVDHHSLHYYETSIRYEHCAFLNATEHGVVVGRGEQKLASAEMWFKNCLFRNCGAGASFLTFNDYDNTFDGCEFVDCGIGVNSVRGNFYVRTSRFVRSKTVDVRQVCSSHASSVRLCTSQGSRRFFETGVGMHQSMKIQDCRVDGWTAPDGAVVLGHRGPTTLFDCVFTNPPTAAPPVRLANPPDIQQLLILSSNVSAQTARLVDEGPNSRITEVPPGKAGPCLTSPARGFLESDVAVPSKVFDAMRDFGAAGDGKDDTDAVQKCIDAARAAGKGAIAYLPSGQYRITRTLNVEGKGFALGGTGFRTILQWDGEKGGVMMRVHNPRGISIEHLVLQGPYETVRIRHTADEGTRTSAFYDGVYTNGCGDDCVAGLWCEDLPEGATVRLGHFIGRLRFTDCGRATILCAVHFYSLVLEGSKHPKTGIAGFMFHNDAVHNYALDVLDNQDVIVADFYSESNERYLLCEGGGRAGAGRVTIGASKVSTKDQECITIRNYEGRIFLGGGDGWWQNNMAEPVRIVQEGERPVYLIIAGQAWWGKEPIFTFGPGMRYAGVENLLMENKYPEYGEKSLPNVFPQGSREALSAALDDFRELAAAYLREYFK